MIASSGDGGLFFFGIEDARLLVFWEPEKNLDWAHGIEHHSVPQARRRRASRHDGKSASASRDTRQAVDATGAGDEFCGATLASIWRRAIQSGMRRAIQPPARR